MTDKLSGSQRILARLGQPDLISDDSLKSVLELANKFDVELLDWCQYGKPGIDGVCGKFQVIPERAGAFVQGLLDIQGWACRLDIFPLGITDPTAINIDMTGGTQAR